MLARSEPTQGENDAAIERGRLSFGDNLIDENQTRKAGRLSLRWISALLDYFSLLGRAYKGTVLGSL